MLQTITVPFRDDTLFAVEDGTLIHVAVKPISDSLGLKWSGQHDRLNRDPILSEGIRVMRMPSLGGEQDTTVLRLDLLNGWLFGIDACRVKPEARPKVLDYQRLCFGVLFERFYGRRGAGDGHNGHALPASPAREEPVSVRRGLVTEARQTFGTRAAGALWLSLGLPVVPEMREGGRQGAFGFTYTAVPTAPGAAEGGR